MDEIDWSRVAAYLKYARSVASEKYERAIIDLKKEPSPKNLQWAGSCTTILGITTILQNAIDEGVRGERMRDLEERLAGMEERLTVANFPH